MGMTMPYADPEKQLAYFRAYDAKRKGTAERKAKVNRTAAKRRAKADPDELRAAWRSAKRRDWAKYRAERIRVSALWRKANPDKVLASKRKAHRRLMERDPDFYNRRYRLNREVIRARARAYYEKNKDRIKVSFAVWRKANHAYIIAKVIERDMLKRRLTEGDLKEIRQFYIHVYTAETIACHYCGNNVPKGEKRRHVDHRVPLCRGGRHAIHNLVGACSKCNLRKHAMTDTEFFLLIGRHAPEPQPVASQEGLQT